MVFFVLPLENSWLSTYPRVRSRAGCDLNRHGFRVVMLRYLRITHLAIIDKVEVEFREGLNVLTGETGAGKSILVGALDLLLGARAGQDVIRSGEEEADIEALFEIPDSRSLPGDLPVESAGELLLSNSQIRAIQVLRQRQSGDSGYAAGNRTGSGEHFRPA
jgi:energy-coupling factor transporter ATP-binding protein EcfA2